MNRIFSGMQPTGNLHLGNYLGALNNWVGLQNAGTAECYFCVVDMHAITVPQPPEKLRAAVRETAAAYIAAGIDTRKSTLFVQSAVPAHAELMWILATFTPLGWLNRMTQIKDKTAKSPENSVRETINQSIRELIDNGRFDEEETERLRKYLEKQQPPTDAGLGLYAYPVLMAADILAYQATHVPVGEDQKQHLELTRDIAGAFNRHYGVDYFKLPEPLIMGEAARVMSLRDGTKKMSKSDESDYSRINLTDDADTISKKIKKATTDADVLPDNLEDLVKRPEADNLITMYASLTDRSRKDVLAEYAGAGWGKFKPALADVAVARLAPISEKMRELLKDTGEIDRILIHGAEHANALTQKHLREVKEIVGLWSLM